VKVECRAFQAYLRIGSPARKIDAPTWTQLPGIVCEKGDFATAIANRPVHVVTTAFSESPTYTAEGIVAVRYANHIMYVSHARHD
jgi:hypothetical protein